MAAWIMRAAFRISLAVRILHADKDTDMNRFMYVYILSDKRSMCYEKQNIKTLKSS